MKPRKQSLTRLITTNKQGKETIMLHVEQFKQLTDVYNLDMNKYGAWKNILRDYDADALNVAIMQYCEQYTKAPTPADIAKLARVAQEDILNQERSRRPQEANREAELEVLYQESLKAKERKYIVCLECRGSHTVRTWIALESLKYHPGYEKLVQAANGDYFKVYILQNN